MSPKFTAKTNSNSLKEPRCPENISISMLSRDIYEKLRVLPDAQMTQLANHIISTQFLLDSNPRLAFEHAKFALSLAGQLDIVREMLGICAYRLGLYKLALRELITARAFNNSNDFIPMIIDCYRGLGQFKKAVEIAERMQDEDFNDEIKTEFNIVMAAAKADDGDYDGAIGILNRELRIKGLSTMERVRLFEAKSEVLDQLGRKKEAQELENKVYPILDKLEKTYEESFIVYDLTDDDETDETDDVTEPRV
ncbi:MAG: hypothetical protein LBC43_03625 [Bifidobacteriaceae bacterium]|jgi:tetratricopeptide (TPR) repeat protein|nr:hypothetical protein [Bifidobacteriaceae bacterium]